MGLTDRDLENTIRDMNFSDAAHRDRLKDRIFHSARELSLDDLTGVAGGVNIEAEKHDEEKWDPWPAFPGKRL